MNSHNILTHFKILQIYSFNISTFLMKRDVTVNRMTSRNNSLCLLLHFPANTITKKEERKKVDFAIETVRARPINVAAPPQGEREIQTHTPPSCCHSPATLPGTAKPGRACRLPRSLLRSNRQRGSADRFLRTKSKGLA